MHFLGSFNSTFVGWTRYARVALVTACTPWRAAPPPEHAQDTDFTAAEVQDEDDADRRDQDVVWVQVAVPDAQVMHPLQHLQQAEVPALDELVTSSPKPDPAEQKKPRLSYAQARAASGSCTPCIRMGREVGQANCSCGAVKKELVQMHMCRPNARMTSRCRCSSRLTSRNSVATK